jgi:flagellar P-ring protein precursor FlgI
MRALRLVRPFAGTLAAVLFALGPGVAGAQDVHLKDVAHVQGVTANQLVGYGLITGLAGTGDSTTFTNKTVQNMLQSFGLSTLIGDVKSKNVAAVVLTASLPPFAHSGDNIDITASSLGDATSLQGGTRQQPGVRDGARPDLRGRFLVRWGRRQRDQESHRRRAHPAGRHHLT